jgi:hypothetical protein
MVLGVVLLAVGAIGMLSGGHDHELVIFGINATHNAVHLASGAVAVIAALAGVAAARGFCIVFGAIYGAVCLAGFVGYEPVVRLLNLNPADNVLHLAIAGASLFVGLVSMGQTAETRRRVPVRFDEQSRGAAPPPRPI